MIPRHKVLIYLKENGDILNEKDVKILFEIINTQVGVFSMIIKDLISNNFVECKGFNNSPSENRSYLFLESFKNLKLKLTEKGNHYIERKIDKTLKRIEFYEHDDPTMNTIKLDNISFNLLAIQTSTFDVFLETYKGKFKNIDIRQAYFILTGKIIKSGKEKIFISYSWDDVNHKKWVKSLADKLQEHYDVIFDQYNCFNIGHDMFDEMKKAIIQADKILIIFTPKYKEKAEINQGGVGYEFSVITEELKKYFTKDKYFPILRSGERKESIPTFFTNRFDLDARKGQFRFNKLMQVLRA